MPKLRQSVQTQYGPVVQMSSLSQSLITAYFYLLINFSYRYLLFIGWELLEISLYSSFVVTLLMALHIIFYFLSVWTKSREVSQHEHGLVDELCWLWSSLHTFPLWCGKVVVRSSWDTQNNSSVFQGISLLCFQTPPSKQGPGIPSSGKHYASQA